MCKFVFRKHLLIKWFACLTLSVLFLLQAGSIVFATDQAKGTLLVAKEPSPITSVAKEPSPMMEDGDYAVGVSLEGGSGKATVTNPCLFTVLDGQAFATLEWSSSYYDYMIVDGVKYLPINEEGNSTFEIPIKAFDEEIPVIADTTAMSTAHEVEYTLTFYSDQIIDAKDTPMARARYSVYMAGVIVLICMAESARKKYVKKKRMRNS